MILLKETFYIDGGCSGNGQHDLSKRRMISVVADSKGTILIDEHNIGGSNNIAEFLALQRVLEYAIANNIKDIQVITDSRNNQAWFKSKRIGRKINDYPRTQEIKNKIEAMKPQLVIDLVWKGRNENLAGNYIENKYTL